MLIKKINKYFISIQVILNIIFIMINKYMHKTVSRHDFH